jgi:hypothetical protein
VVCWGNQVAEDNKGLRGSHAALSSAPHKLQKPRHAAMTRTAHGTRSAAKFIDCLTCMSIQMVRKGGTMRAFGSGASPLPECWLVRSGSGGLCRRCATAGRAMLANGGGAPSAAATRPGPPAATHSASGGAPRLPRCAPTGAWPTQRPVAPQGIRGGRGAGSQAPRRLVAPRTRPGGQQSGPPRSRSTPWRLCGGCLLRPPSRPRLAHVKNEGGTGWGKNCLTAPPNAGQLRNQQ